MSEKPEEINTTTTEGTEEKSKAALKKEQKKKEKEEKIAAIKAAKAAAAAAAGGEQGGQQQKEKKVEETAPEDNYGKLELNRSTTRENKQYTNIAQLDVSKDGQKVLVRGRVQASRLQGANLCFVFLRDSLYTVQAVVAKSGKVSKNMVKFVGDIPRESIVDIEATVVKTKVPIESATQKDIELAVNSVWIVSEAAQLPILIDDLARCQTLIDSQATEIEELEKLLENASLSETEKKDLEKKKSEAAKYVVVSQEKRLDNRVLDLRVPAHQSIFRVQSGVCTLFREYLLDQGFMEIHTPKIISSASESGASVFKLGYFGGNAYLAQSPQFYKQMAIASDFSRVFEIGPVFRAENSNTHRHMTEFVGLDLEMTFREHYHEVLDVLDDLMTSIFHGLETRFAKELDSIRTQYPFEPFTYTRPSPRFTFDQAAAFLAEEGAIVKDNDFSTAQEKLLGKIIKKKYGVDFFIVDKFHAEVRPFYSMADPNNPGLANAYDMFMRGEEICSGAQRVHDAALLEEKAKAHGLNIADIQAYIDAFKYGCSQHAGGGVGLERVVMLYLGIGNIRKTSMFPRDPTRITP